MALAAATPTTRLGAGASCFPAPGDPGHGLRRPGGRNSGSAAAISAATSAAPVRAGHAYAPASFGAAAAGAFTASGPVPAHGPRRQARRATAATRA